eukprot:16931-Heterococcus_DN1.PRE.1
MDLTVDGYCGTIDSGADRQCCVSGEYADSDTAAMTVLPGYWRESVSQNYTHECWNSAACKRGIALLDA